MDKKITLDDILNDTSGLLDLKPEISNVKSEEDRLIDSFEEVNVFVDKNNRVPNSSSMSEYSLLAKLRNFRKTDVTKNILKPFDRHNLLGYVEIEKTRITDVLNDDSSGLLDVDNELEIFKFKHTPKPQNRAKTDFSAKRKPLKDEEFGRYEKMFQKIHQDLREGKRRIKAFKNVKKYLQEGGFYLLDGVLLYLEKVNSDRGIKNLGKNTSRRKDGRTKTIFENATISNMLYRSLGKSLYNNGKIITDLSNQKLFIDKVDGDADDISTGWIYVLKSKSSNTKISSIKNLYKIGFSSTPVDERIKNAKNEATYLFADVETIVTYKIYNRNALKLENLLHNFFSSACLNIDLFNKQNQRITPREWFIVPLYVIEEAINLIINENIVNYKYNSKDELIKFR